MSLRLQLLAFVALTFLLPWAGIRLVQSVEETLRSGLESLLTTSAELAATRVADSDAFRRRASARDGLSEPLYAHTLSRQPELDGFRDWQFARSDDGIRPIVLDDGTRLWLGIDPPNFLYLFVDVDDDEIVLQASSYTEPPYGDRVVLIFGRDPANPDALLLACAGGCRASGPDTGAAGVIRAQPTTAGGQFVPTGGFEDLVRGYWLTRRGRDGYSVEARIPLGIVAGAIGIAVIDSDSGGATARMAAKSWNDAGAPNALIRESDELEQILGPYENGSQRYRIFDADGWVLADAGSIDPPPSLDPEASPSVIERLFRRLLRRDDPEYAGALEVVPGRIGDETLLAVLDGTPTIAWYRRGADVNAIVAAAVPIDPDNPDRGGILIEQANDPILSVTNEAMLRVVTTTVVVTLIASLALLGYASFLSFRIGRLARAAESALGPRGEIRARLPGSRATDEIGDLSRSFQDLLKRLREYTEYLQSLKSKLSHELRTPLAIVSTSADNLEHETDSEAGKAYLNRLRQGAERLEAILRAMTAATRVEQAIANAELERFDLNEVIGPAVFAYRDVYAGFSFVLSLSETPLHVTGSAELVAQMLDKLVDNAVSFAHEGTAIEVSLTRDGGEIRLEVTNRGPLLPESMRHQIFDSLVSVRDQSSDKPHLGLGLHIVTLVAEFHGGRVEADNLADGSGVTMTVVLPGSDAGTA